MILIIYTLLISIWGIISDDVSKEARRTLSYILASLSITAAAVQLISKIVELSNYNASFRKAMILSAFESITAIKDKGWRNYLIEANLIKDCWVALISALKSAFKAGLMKGLFSAVVGFTILSIIFVPLALFVLLISIFSPLLKWATPCDPFSQEYGHLMRGKTYLSLERSNMRMPMFEPEDKTFRIRHSSVFFSDQENSIRVCFEESSTFNKYSMEDPSSKRVIFSCLKYLEEQDTFLAKSVDEETGHCLSLQDLMKAKDLEVSVHFANQEMFFLGSRGFFNKKNWDFLRRLTEKYFKGDKALDYLDSAIERRKFYRKKPEEVGNRLWKEFISDVSHYCYEQDIHTFSNYTKLDKSINYKNAMKEMGEVEPSRSLCPQSYLKVESASSLMVRETVFNKTLFDKIVTPPPRPVSAKINYCLSKANEDIVEEKVRVRPDGKLEGDIDAMVELLASLVKCSSVGKIDKKIKKLIRKIEDVNSNLNYLVSEKGLILKFMSKEEKMRLISELSKVGDEGKDISVHLKRPVYLDPPKITVSLSEKPESKNYAEALKKEMENPETAYKLLKKHKVPDSMRKRVDILFLRTNGNQGPSKSSDDKREVKKKKKNVVSEKVCNLDNKGFDIKLTNRFSILGDANSDPIDILGAENVSKITRGVRIKAKSLMRRNKIKGNFEGEGNKPLTALSTSFKVVRECFKRANTVLDGTPAWAGVHMCVNLTRLGNKVSNETRLHPSMSRLIIKNLFSLEVENMFERYDKSNWKSRLMNKTESKSKKKSVEKTGRNVDNDNTGMGFMDFH